MKSAQPEHSCADEDDLFEAVAAEFTTRLRAGDRPTIDEYAARHPTLADLLRELLPTISAIETAKLQQAAGAGHAAVRSPMPEQLGDFRILREIGSGGMGIVYEAMQLSLDRPVAVKVLPSQALLDPRRVQRFEQEARIAASLHHTNIVPVFGVGHDGGLHYYVMQLIDGDGLDRLSAQAGERPSPRRIAEIGRDVARALQHAHTEGTLHRDVKPANILLDRTGHVWITDFGLAQILESNVTLSAQYGGTLRYMPPERFHGQSDARGDIYSLGITLYELLVGQPAFDATTSVELIRKITESAPPRLRLLDPRIPRDLETIVAKATAREPEHRYRTAAEFADDLHRFLEEQPIHARRVSPLERGWRWCRRNRLSATAIGVALASLLSLSAVSAVGYWRTTALNSSLKQSLQRETHSRGLAETASSTALEALDEVFTRLAPNSPRSAVHSAASDLGDDVSARLTLPDAPSVSPQVAAALEALMPYYLRLAEQREDDPGVRRRAASAMHKIGMIHARLGRFDAARDAWRRAAELSSELAQDASLKASDADLALLLATIDCDQGDLEREQERFSESRASYGRALSGLERLSASDLPFEARREMARAHLALALRERPPAPAPSPGSPPGPSHGHPPKPPLGRPPGLGPGPGPGPHRGGPREGPPPGPRPPEFERRPPPDHPKLDGRPPEHLEPESPQADDPPDRREHLDAAHVLLQQLLTERPADPPSRLLMARLHRERAKEGAAERLEKNRREFDQGLKLLRGLWKEFPSSPDFAFELSEALADVRPRDIPKDEWRPAERRLREALEISESLVRDHPQTAAYAASQAHILHRLGGVLREHGERPEAEAVYRRCLEVQQGLVRQSPQALVYAYWQARMERNLAEFLAEERRFPEAMREIEGGLAALKPHLQGDATATPAVEMDEQLRGMLDDLKRRP